MLCLEQGLQKGIFRQNKFKIYRRNVFEDVDFVTRAVYFSNKLVTVPNTFYHYWTNQNSTVKTMKISDKKRADSLKSKEMVLKFFKEHNLKSKSRNLIKRKHL